jgi:ribosome biogenesis GTPase
MTTNLVKLGWSSFFEEHFRPFGDHGLIPGRVARQDRDSCLAYCEQGEVAAEVTGRFRYEALSRSDFPAVGDWVAIDAPTEQQTTRIHAILPRNSCFSRKEAGAHTEEQIGAANVDTVFLVSGLDGDFNLRRIERYLTVAYNSGASPVVVLNKTDVCDDVEARIGETESIAFGVPVCPVSAVEQSGVTELLSHLDVGQTGVFVGSSGVGKSSLINCLLGSDQLAVGPVRQDDSHGRHTTTHRELICLAQGGIIIDTPGMRELQLWTDEDSVGGSFQDVEEIAQQCRFRNCKHVREPRCAVRAAIENGSLPSQRLESYRKLRRELARLEWKQARKARAADRASGGKTAYNRGALPRLECP